MLRFVTPVMNFRRQSTTETELSGQKIKADQKVVFFHISANRDESVFEAPDRFDITRKPNPHIAFGGGGPHFCLGANLAGWRSGSCSSTSSTGYRTSTSTGRSNDSSPLSSTG